MIYNPGWAQRFGFHEHIGILSGWEWLTKHEHDLDGWSPELEITRPGSRYTIRTQDNRALNKAVKIITSGRR